MACKYNLMLMIWSFISNYLTFVESRGVLLLHHPIDVTNHCVQSDHLRYDIAFGAGRADTITLILRTILDVDYECEIDISSDNRNNIIVVVHYPTNLLINCNANPFAFHVMKKDECLPICDMLDYKDKFSKDWVMFTKGRFRFQFRSSSNVNTDMDAHYYSVTVTTARMRDSNGSCFSEMNETECYAPPPLNEHYCITSSVVCDGINNCGVKDWFDEKKSDCDMPQPLLSWVSIFAVVSLIICTLLAGSHILLSSFPQGTTYFVFNSNEDNRFCLNPTLTVPDRQPVKERRKTFDYNSSDTSFDSDEEKETMMTDLYESPFNVEAEEKAALAKDKKQSVSKRLQQSIHSIAWRPSLRPTVLKKFEEVL